VAQSPFPLIAPGADDARGPLYQGAVCRVRVVVHRDRHQHDALAAQVMGERHDLCSLRDLDLELPYVQDIDAQHVATV
jgi:hypothetical protein